MNATEMILLVKSDVERIEKYGYTPYGELIIMTKKYFENIKGD